VKGQLPNENTSNVSERVAPMQPRFYPLRNFLTTRTKGKRFDTPETQSRRKEMLLRGKLLYIATLGQKKHNDWTKACGKETLQCSKKNLTAMARPRERVKLNRG